MNALVELMQDDLCQAPPSGLDGLLTALQARYGAQLLAVVLYGSCRRDQDIHDGLVDLLVLVRDYGAVHGLHPSSVLNRLLPPNVYFLQTGQDQQAVRCKYALITLDQFAKRCRSRADHYFWARFTQPCRLVFAQDALDLPARIAESRAVAAQHYCRRIAPLLTAPATPSEFWQLALTTSYCCELRPEPPDNALRLIAADPEYWRALTQKLADQGDCGLVAKGPTFESLAGRARRGLTRLQWRLRRVSGKTFNLARLFKAAGTFSNGIDYITWKVERHSGVRITPTERMRRHPRLAAWGLAWRMWRQGGFR
ncbi:MAG: hypothetical protein V2J42_11475 [Wenzhouxiangella sp.]|nr:hypothetical protein [Wenzhouxiangella sp.]